MNKSDAPKTLDEAVIRANAAIEEFNREHELMRASALKVVDAFFSPAAEKKFSRVAAK